MCLLNEEFVSDESGHLHDFMVGEQSLLRSCMLTHTLVVMFGKMASFKAEIDLSTSTVRTLPYLNSSRIQSCMLRP